MDRCGVFPAAFAASALTALLFADRSFAQDAADEVEWVGTCTRLVIAGADKSKLCVDQLKRRRSQAAFRFIFGLSDGTPVSFVLAPSSPTLGGTQTLHGTVTGVSIGTLASAAQPATGTCSVGDPDNGEILTICKAFGESGVFEATFRAKVAN